MKAKKDKKAVPPLTIDYENKRLSVLYFIPLLLIAGFVPLIVYAKYIDLSETTQSLYWTGQQQYLDFFSYWKSKWVITLSFTSFIIYLILLKQKKLPLKNLKQYYIPLGLYGIFVIISTIFAIDTQTALWGFVDMYQGMFVLLSYVLITVLTINFVNNERDVYLFVKAFLFLMIVEGVIGIGQYLGFDFFQTEVAKSLIIPSNLRVENLSFAFGPKTIYGTLFNTNFVGSFAVLMLPISIAFLFGANTNKQRAISAITTILMIFIWIGCNSRAGYFGFIVAIIFALWIIRNRIIKHIKKISIIFSAFIMILLIVNFASGNKIYDRIKTFNLPKQIEEIKNISNNVRFEDIVINEQSFSIITNRETINFKVIDDKLFIYDENLNELRIKTRGNNITIDDPKYEWYRITISEKYPGLTVERGTYWGWMTINFYFAQDGVKVIGSGGRLTMPVEASRIKYFDGLEPLMSARGYIWSRSIPLLNFNWLKGSGADNYPMAFPQDDYVGKLNAGMDGSMVVDKPHNMYFQTAVNTGVISLLSLLSVFIIYIVSSLKIYSKIVIKNFEGYIGLSCLISVIGYLLTAIFNDNIVSVTPLFWIILGLGISINVRLKKSISYND